MGKKSWPMGNISWPIGHVDAQETSMSSTAEAADLIFKLAPGAKSKGERRSIVWRKLSAHFTYNRICQLDRKSSRCVVTGDELNILRAACESLENKDGTENYAIKLECADLRNRVAILEALLAKSAAADCAELDGVRSLFGSRR